jgi:hypothetical protein
VVICQRAEVSSVLEKVFVVAGVSFFLHCVTDRRKGENRPLHFFDARNPLTLNNFTFQTVQDEPSDTAFFPLISPTSVKSRFELI